MAADVSPDPFNLARFGPKQEKHYDTALAELRQGRKQGHWIWYVFPQLVGLGKSPRATEFGISGLEEARAYLAHPVLGARLRESAEVMLAGTRTAPQVLGSVDAVKLRSSATLFALVSEPGSVFHQLLDRFFEGKQDEKTVSLLREADPSLRTG